MKSMIENLLNDDINKDQIIHMNFKSYEMPENIYFGLEQEKN